MNEIDFQKIKELSEEFFRKMGFEVELEIKSFSAQSPTFSVDLKTEEPQILIGERGQTLFEIQHLLKTVLKRKILSSKLFYLDLDINNYKKKKIEYLKEVARTSADEVVLTKKEKILAPMPAYERRIIHLELASRNDVMTESIGQEPERKVAIRPYP